MSGMISRGGIEFPNFAAQHRQSDETFADLEERLREAERMAFPYFHQATLRQRMVYLRAICAMRGKSDASQAKALTGANSAWARATREQSELFDKTTDEVMRNGCVSARTKAEWASFEYAQMEAA